METTLYARDSRGNVKYWKLSIVSNLFCITSGKLGSAGNKMHKQPDNLDNITKEYNAIVAKKKKEGYKDIPLPNIEHLNMISYLEANVTNYNTDDNNNAKPMKCQTFQANKMVYPAFAQPKLNGIRCFTGFGLHNIDIFNSGYKAKLYSKLGLEYIMNHITDDLTILYKSHTFIEYFETRGFDVQDIHLDGELYIPNKPLSFIRASCPTKNSKGTISKSTNDSNDIKLHIFDIAIVDVDQSIRFRFLQDIQLMAITLGLTNLIFVDTINIHSDEEAKTYRDSCISAGYEGCVIRKSTSTYAFGQRSKDVLKYKAWDDGEFEIIDILDKATSELQGGTRTFITFVCRNDINTNIFESTPLGDEEQRQEYLNNKHLYIGKKATVKYYERSGVEAVPFHSNVVAIRDYE